MAVTQHTVARTLAARNMTGVQRHLLSPRLIGCLPSVYRKQHSSLSCLRLVKSWTANESKLAHLVCRSFITKPTVPRTWTWGCGHGALRSMNALPHFDAFFSLLLFNSATIPNCGLLQPTDPAGPKKLLRGQSSHWTTGTQPRIRFSGCWVFPATSNGN